MGTTSKGKPRKVDEDPEGAKLLEKDPMEEATKLLKTLVLNCSLDLQTYTLMYEVCSREGRLLHCLQALVQLWRLSGRDNLHYKLIAPLAHFCFVIDLESDSVSSIVKDVILSEMAPLLGSEGGAAFNSVTDLRKAAREVVASVEDRMNKNPELPVIEVLYSLKCLKHAGVDSRNFQEKWNPQGAFALKECKKMLAYLASECGEDSPFREKFEKRCLEIFPLMPKQKAA